MESWSFFLHKPVPPLSFTNSFREQPRRTAPLAPPIGALWHSV